MRREGSPWHGLGVVFLKELSDHLSSVRMRVLEWLVVLIAIVAIYLAIQQIKEATAEDPFLYLRLMTQAPQPLPSFMWLLEFLVPVVAIGLGFDLVNGEHNRRTLSRVLAQPIYRDALLLGKFLGGLATIAIGLLALWLLVIGLALVLTGIPPGLEEMARSLVMLAVTIVYAGVWLAVAMLFSIVLRSPASAALVTLGIWLFLTILWPLLSPAVAAAFTSPEDPLTALTTRQDLARLSPSTLFNEVMLAVLHPSVNTLGPIFLDQLRGAVVGAPLPLAQSLLVAWPQIVGLVAAAILVFVIGYVAFQRQEVRA